MVLKQVDDGADAVLIKALCQYLTGKIDRSALSKLIRELYPRRHPSPLVIAVRAAFVQAELDNSDKIIRSEIRRLLRERSIKWYSEL